MSSSRSESQQREQKEIEDIVEDNRFPSGFNFVRNPNLIWTPIDKYIAVTNPTSHKTSLIAFRIGPEDKDSGEKPLNIDKIDLPQAATYLQSLGNSKMGTLVGRNISIWDLSKLPFNQSEEEKPRNTLMQNLDSMETDKKKSHHASSSMQTLNRIASFTLSRSSDINPTLCFFHGHSFVYYDASKASINIFNLDNQVEKNFEIENGKGTPIKSFHCLAGCLAMTVQQEAGEASMDRLILFNLRTYKIRVFTPNNTYTWSTFSHCFASPNQKYFVIKAKIKSEKLIIKALQVYAYSSHMPKHIVNIPYDAKSPQIQWLADNTLVYLNEHSIGLFDPSNLSSRKLITLNEITSTPVTMFSMPNGNLHLVELVPNSRDLTNTIPSLCTIQTKNIQNAAELILTTAAEVLKDNEIPPVLIDLIKEYSDASSNLTIFTMPFTPPKHLPTELKYEMSALYQYYNQELQQAKTNPKHQEKYVHYRENALSLRALAKAIEDNPNLPLHQVIDTFKSNLSQEIASSISQETWDLVEKISNVKMLSHHASTESDSESSVLRNKRK